jgi:lysophospholipase L1-like esterase
MLRIKTIIRGAVGTAIVGASLSCTSDHTVLMPAVADPIFSNYVAIGNSITAGFQSDGINDSTQQRSYAVLLSRQMHTRFAYPALAGRGCRPPIANFLTQARVGTGSTATTCDLRLAGSVTDIINNVAVPGVKAEDPTAVTGPSSSPLTVLFLGGKTQIQRALQAQPTFATVWIGNNDVLQPAITGVPATATSQTNFVASYSKMINELVAGAPGLKGVLIAVVQVAGAPVLFDAKAVLNPAFLAGLNAATGKTIVVDATTCTPTTTSLIGVPLIAQIASGAHPPLIACGKGGPFPAPVGDILVLDAAEQTQAAGIINGYNAYIKAKADSIGFAFYDPNPTLAGLKATGQIPAVPTLTSATNPFGTYFSLDGVHPSTTAHILIANDLIAVINTKYGTSLQKVQ